MIFPNRAPNPQMGPGMGYAPGARGGMGYLTHMGYAPGARSGMGEFSAAMENAAVDANIAPSDIDLLNSLGATDQDLSNLINGNVTLSQLYAQYGVTIPPTSTATANTTPAVTTAATAPVLQSPQGSTLLFTCNWTAGVGNLSVSPNAAIAALTSQIQSHGMSVISNSVTSSGPINYGITVTLLDSVGHDTIANALTVPTAIMQGIVGNNFSSTPTLSLITAGGSGAPGAVPNPTTNALTWLENNALYIALGVGGLIFLNNFTSGKRR